MPVQRKPYPSSPSAAAGTQHMTSPNFIRQFVTILSLNKTRDFKRKDSAQVPCGRRNPFFCMARSACFFYFIGKAMMHSFAHGTKAALARKIGRGSVRSAPLSLYLRLAGRWHFPYYFQQYRKDAPWKILTQTATPLSMKKIPVKS